MTNLKNVLNYCCRSRTTSSPGPSAWEAPDSSDHGVIVEQTKLLSVIFLSLGVGVGGLYAEVARMERTMWGWGGVVCTFHGAYYTESLGDLLLTASNWVMRNSVRKNWPKKLTGSSCDSRDNLNYLLYLTYKRLQRCWVLSCAQVTCCHIKGGYGCPLRAHDPRFINTNLKATLIKTSSSLSPSFIEPCSESHQSDVKRSDSQIL